MIEDARGVAAAELTIKGGWVAAELANVRQRVERLWHFHSSGAIAKAGRVQMAASASLHRHEAVTVPSADIAQGAEEQYALVARSALFDADWYLNLYPDVRLAGLDPVFHYLTYGGAEGRSPGPAFDGAAYLAANADLAAIGINPLVHYECHGRFEGRALAPSRPLILPDQIVHPAPLAWMVELRSLDEYRQFEEQQPAAFSHHTEHAIARHCTSWGTSSAFQGDVGPEQTAVTGTDLREHLISAGLNSRQRAVADLVLMMLREAGVAEIDARIYGQEAITPLAWLMRQRFRHFVGTEYAPTKETQRAIFPAMHNDVCASRFEDEVFNVIFSCDVLEHVYDRDLLLSESARTLMSGGAFVATFPFDHDCAVGWLMAELRDGHLVHHLDEPIYHGNPMDLSGGSLVFEIPGWDILPRAVAAGFHDAAMYFICDQRRGIAATPQGTGSRPRGVFVLVARK